MDILQNIRSRAKEKSARVVFPEGDDIRIIEAAARISAQGLARPVILGEPEAVLTRAREKSIDLDMVQIISTKNSDMVDRYAGGYAKMRGQNPLLARKMVQKPIGFGGMMLRENDADAMVAGVATATGTVIQLAALTVGLQDGLSTPSSFFMMVIPEFDGRKNEVFFFADCAVITTPTAMQLSDIAIATAENARKLLGIDPRVAFLSFSTKGSASHPSADTVIAAVAHTREKAPELCIDGELQADAAIVARVAEKKVVPPGDVAGRANILVFPDLNSGNIAYKLVQYLGGASAFGPILQGFAGPVCDLSRGASVDDIVSTTAIACAMVT